MVAMTKSERQELGMLIRKRERVMKSQAHEGSAHMVAEFEGRLRKSIITMRTQFGSAPLLKRRRSLMPHRRRSARAALSWAYQRAGWRDDRAEEGSGS
jgi:hypothetical protein